MGHDSIRISQFVSLSFSLPLSGFLPYLGERNHEIASYIPRQIYEGPIRSCSSFVPVCVNRVATPRRATLAPFSRTSQFPGLLPMKPLCRRPAKEAASLIGIQNLSRPLFPAFSPLSPFVPLRSACNGALYFTSHSIRDADKLVRRRENISPVSFFFLSLRPSRPFVYYSPAIMTVEFRSELVVFSKWQDSEHNRTVTFCSALNQQTFDF